MTFIMMLQVARPKLQLSAGSFLLSDTYGTIISSQKNAERFEIATCLV